ncbi:MAG: hypothetical protein HF967_01835 [Methanosarcinales archaeon]|nr:hypothetical protein [Methanosarcinales archaeon]
MMQDENEYKSWIKITKKKFYKFVRKLELVRRRNKENKHSFVPNEL